MPTRSTRPVRLLTALGVCVALAVGSCSLIVDTNSEQCSSDAECLEFPAAVCDVAQHVCVAREAGGGGESGGPAIEPPGGAGVGGAGAGTGPDGAGAGGEGAGGEGAGVDPCDASEKPEIEVSDDINTPETWSCEFDYVLTQVVHVGEGVTLTIQAGTTVRGVPGQAPPNYVEPGALIVSPGAKLEAVGTPTRPVVFTSTAEPGFGEPGQWGGVILLGKATINQGSAVIEGVPAGGTYGGTDDDDSSGTLQYVRIEYSGFTLSTGKEINGLTLAGVGRGTTIDHVQVRRASDDCFEFFGGTVDAKYLICQGNEDDGFDFDFGFRGRLQFLILQQDGRYMNLDDAMNGIESDNEGQALATPSEPRTEPIIYNMTLCGQGAETPMVSGTPKDRFGMLWRRNSGGHVHNSLVLGFEAGIDIRDTKTSVEIDSSAFFGNTWGTNGGGNLGYPESAGGAPGVLADDDAGFDEHAEYAASNSQTDPRVVDCFNPTQPNFAPGQALTLLAVQPPADGFFLPVKYVGAVRDANDGWWTEPWIVWSDE